MEEKVYITIYWVFLVIGFEEKGFVDNISLSPVTYEQKLRFGIKGDEEQYSFDELREKLKQECFKRAEKLHLFVVNPETGEKQNFSIDISAVWPEDLVGGKRIGKKQSTEITSCLKKIGVL